MSRAVLRRKDKEMSQSEIEDLLRNGFVGHFATVDAEGQPYVVPNLYVYEAGKIYSHNTQAQGHFRQNILVNPRVCFEIAEPGEVFPYGEFECDTSVSFRSAVCFGRIKILAEREAKQRFFDLFMAKYSEAEWERPKSFYPRLDQVTVYCLEIEQMTGKQNPLPAMSQRWPVVNNTRTPNAVAPSATASITTE
jgi:nitroimidazol reductase NimA-like FMN-containing flavoprotein (pyridoxamine 5'-phosphate oxidase superfamily)